MPDENFPVRLEWNDENLAKVISDLYREADTNETLREQLMTNPFEALNSRISVPEAYRGGIFSRERNQQILMLYVPPVGAGGDVAPRSATETEVLPNYAIICSLPPPW